MSMHPEIERIRLRCVCGDDGCWHWSGSMNRNSIPTLTRFVDGVKKCVSGRRWVLEMLSGKPLRSENVVITTCDSCDCLNPEHLRPVTRGTIQRRKNEKDPGLQMRRGIAIKLAWNRKGKGHKLTSEQADYARDPARPVKEVAAELGVTPQMVYYIRSGKVWRQATNPFSSLLG